MRSTARSRRPGTRIANGCRLPSDRRRDLLIDLADAVHENLDELSRLNVVRLRGANRLRPGNCYSAWSRFLRHFAGLRRQAARHLDAGDRLVRRSI